MPPHFSPDEIRLIRTHRLETEAYVVIRPDNCFGLTASILRTVRGRRLIPIEPGALKALNPGRSWILAVPLCPGESVEEVAGFARSVAAGERHRIWFFELGKVDVFAAYASWRDAGLGTPRRDAVTDRADLNKVLSNELNIRILLDHLPSAFEGERLQGRP